MLAKGSASAAGFGGAQQTQLRPRLELPTTDNNEELFKKFRRSLIRILLSVSHVDNTARDRVFLSAKYIYGFTSADTDVKVRSHLLPIELIP